MIVLFAILLWMLKLFWVWVGFGMIGAAFAFALRFGLDRAADAERFVPIAACEKLLRRLRVLGLDENQVRFFVAKYAGRDWEEFFEALFGYEAKLEVRSRLLRGESAGERNRFAPWREPVIAILDRIESARRSQAERDMLVKVEQDRLRATGLTERAAHQRAEETADMILQRAAALKTAESHRNMKAITTLQATVSGQSKEAINLQRLLDDLPKIEQPQDRFQQFTSFAVGPAVRGTVAIIALILFGLWTIQNNVFSVVAGDGILPLTAEPLEIQGVPPQLTQWVDNANIGVASVLLLTSLLYRGTRMGLLVLVGAAVATIAHRFGIPAVDPVRDYHVGLMLGTVIALVGYRFGQR
jgi:hypothetical protein